MVGFWKLRINFGAVWEGDGPSDPLDPRGSYSRVGGSDQTPSRSVLDKSTVGL